MSNQLLAGNTSSESKYLNGAVAADHPVASQAGVEILRKGGNVVDAAVATSFALSVVRPGSCGVGGGGFMVIWDSEKQQAVAIDYRETAPASANADMFSGPVHSGSSEPKSVRGGLAVAVPGHVAGLCYVAEEFGSLPLDELLQPAIRLAEQGVLIDSHDKNIQRSVLARMERHDGYTLRFSELHHRYLNQGISWNAEDRFHSPQLPLLRMIAERGAEAFYAGDVAKAIVQTVQSEDGMITLDDLASTRPVVRQVLAGEFQKHRVITMPPPSSGGVALLEVLGTLEQWQQLHKTSLAKLGHNSPEYIHIVTEAMKHAFADRAEFLGDADFVDVPVERLISRDYAKDIASKIDRERTLKPEQYGRFFSQSDSGTSHYSVIDSRGNAVACTETINLTFGSFVVVPEYGIVLNNEMDDFAARPGEVNAFGLKQSAANAIEPGKKPLSSMTPTILVKDGRAVYATGASGGPRIISATLQSVLNHTLFEHSPLKSVSSPRFHHQWFPDNLVLEQPLYNAIQDEMKVRGHSVRSSSGLAAAQAASRSHTGLSAGSDPRKHGAPAGY